MKKFDLEYCGDIYQIQLSVSTYQNGNLAITMTDWSSGEPEPWNVLTVNLGFALSKDCAFIDTNNNGNDILSWIIRYGLAVPTGRKAVSGFRSYPEYRFRKSILMDMPTIFKHWGGHTTHENKDLP